MLMKANVILDQKRMGMHHFLKYLTTIEKEPIQIGNDNN